MAVSHLVRALAGERAHRCGWCQRAAIIPARGRSYLAAFFCFCNMVPAYARTARTRIPHFCCTAQRR
jgi:hypothetical protein